MKIQKFEDIQSWQKARELNKKIYSLFQSSRDFAFRDQIQRASVSITSNIAEGFDRHTNKEFIYFLAIAKGSASEVRSLLYLALDLGYITEKEFESIFPVIEDVSKMIYGFMSYLQDFEKNKIHNIQHETVNSKH